MFADFIKIDHTLTKEDLLCHSITTAIVKGKLPKVMKGQDIDITTIKNTLKDRGYLFEKFFGEFVLAKDTEESFKSLETITDIDPKIFAQKYKFRSVRFVTVEGVVKVVKRIRSLEKPITKVGSLKSNKFNKDVYQKDDLIVNLLLSGNKYEISENDSHWKVRAIHPGKLLRSLSSLA